MRGLALCLAALVLLLAPTAACAATFKVKSTGDGPDSNTADAVCATSGTDTSTCTLRAAIEQANGNGEVDTIQFSGSTVAGETIHPATPLPSLDFPVTIDGCSSDAGHVGPCVGLSPTDDSIDGLSVEAEGEHNISTTKIKGLAITNALTGINARPSSAFLTIKNNWFGIRLDKTIEANVFTGVLLQGFGAEVGGDTSVERNVLSASTHGLQINGGGGGNTVQGNRFGTMPDGSGSVPNEEDNIEVVNILAGADPITIGGTVSASQAATAKCDGVCNLIVNAGSSGIDLTGEGGESETPAQDTTVAGNFIGLSRSGTTDKGNAPGIYAQSTTGTTIGGETSGARNFIAGNDSYPINLFMAEDPVVKRNYIGFDSSGAAAVPNSTFVLMGEGTFERNRVGGDGTTPADGLLLDEIAPATVVHNTFGVGTGGQHRGFGDSAIEVIGNQKDIGGPTDEEANTIGNSGEGVQIVDGDGNDVEGNHIGTDPSGTEDHGNETGVLITNDGDDPNGNVVQLNLISNSETDAIRLEGDDSDFNFLAQNFGKSNGDPTSTACGGGPCDLFIDLAGSDGFGNGVSGPNDGIAAPAITSVENVGDMTVTGTGAPDGAMVFVYRTKAAAGISPNRIEQVLDTDATVAGGSWTATFPHVSSEGRITALVVDGSNNTSELALSRPKAYP